MNHLGDYDLSAVIYGMFNTFDPATGELITLGGSGASLVVFKNNGGSESSAGVSLTIDFDGREGCHAFNIDASADGAFYSAGGAFSVIINGGTAGAVSLAGAVVSSFSLRKDSSLKPTTAGRALDVTAAGNAGIDWANVENPTTALNLSGTNIDVDQVVASVSGAVGSVTGAVGSVTGNVGGNVVGSVASVTGNVGGNVTGSVGSVAADGITSSSMAASAVTEIQSGLATSAAVATVDGKVDAIGVLTLDLPTNAEFNARTLAAASYATATAVDDLPTNAELAARTLLAASYATAAAQAVTDGKVDVVDGVVDGIAAKTVQLTFGATNTLNANVTHVIADPVQQNGSTTTEWGGAP